MKQLDGIHCDLAGFDGVYLKYRGMDVILLRIKACGRFEELAERRAACLFT